VIPCKILWIVLLSYMSHVRERKLQKLMLAIRMQRTGRKGHAMFRVVVQDARRTPSSGRVVAQLGSYDPHTKTVILEKEKATQYLQNGAQPSERVVRLLQAEGVDLPKWVTLPTNKTRGIRNPDKLRKNQPKEEAPAAEAENAESAE
jgi:small subunit ribosomal protein S16